MMSFDWRHYLKVAEESAARGATSPEPEAWYRCATSRAYYAAFNSVLSGLRRDPGVSVNFSREPHKHVIDTLSKGDRSRIQLAGRLEDLRAKRVRADYEDARLPQSVASDAIKSAADIIATAARIL